jgi:hypothetical protein
MKFKHPRPFNSRLITGISKINTSSEEGKLLMAALVKLTTESQTTK